MNICWPLVVVFRNEEEGGFSTLFIFPFSCRVCKLRPAPSLLIEFPGAPGTRQYVVRAGDRHMRWGGCILGMGVLMYFSWQNSSSFHAFSFFVSCVHCGYFHPPSCLEAAPQQVLGPLRPGAHFLRSSSSASWGKAGAASPSELAWCDVGRERGGRYLNQLLAPVFT